MSEIILYGSLGSLKHYSSSCKNIFSNSSDRTCKKKATVAKPRCKTFVYFSSGLIGNLNLIPASENNPITYILIGREASENAFSNPECQGTLEDESKISLLIPCDSLLVSSSHLVEFRDGDIPQGRILFEIWSLNTKIPNSKFTSIYSVETKAKSRITQISQENESPIQLLKDNLFMVSVRLLSNKDNKYVMPVSIKTSLCLES